jgi:nitrite reductase (NADH) small subunit
MTIEWTCIATVADCPPGTSKEIVVGDRVVALFNVQGEFHALDGVCPHQGGPLGRGTLQGDTVTCPWHGWQFDVRSGQCGLSRSVVQPNIPVRLDGDLILIRL